MSNKSSFNKQFWKFVIPSVLSLSLTGIYCFVDAFFVGNMVGNSGLAAINISFAFISVVFALGSGIGAGSSVKYSFYKAQGNETKAQDYIGAAFLMCFVCSILATVPMIAFPKQILLLLGASETVSNIGESYLFINGCGTIFQLFGNGTIPIVRNCGGSITAMISVVSGCILNIILDWLFVWVLNWGMEGAAWATVLGQVLSLLICLLYLFKHKKIQIGCKAFKQEFRDIVTIGLSPFGLCLVPNISVVVLNKASLYFGGDPAIAAYGCMAYLVFVVYLIMQGVGEGAQPLISTFHGQCDYTSIRIVKKKVFSLTLILAFVFFIIEFFFSEALARFMGSTGESQQIIKRGLPVLAVGFFFVGLSRSIASCLYAEEHNIQSYIISYAEPLLILVCILILSPLGLDSVWFSNTIAQFIVMLIAIVFLKWTNFCI